MTYGKFHNFSKFSKDLVTINTLTFNLIWSNSGFATGSHWSDL